MSLIISFKPPVITTANKNTIDKSFILIFQLNSRDELDHYSFSTYYLTENDNK